MHDNLAAYIIKYIRNSYTVCLWIVIDEYIYKDSVRTPDSNDVDNNIMVTVLILACCFMHTHYNIWTTDLLNRMRLSIRLHNDRSTIVLYPTAAQEEKNHLTIIYAMTASRILNNNNDSNLWIWFDNLCILWIRTMVCTLLSCLYWYRRFFDIYAARDFLLTHQ